MKKSILSVLVAGAFFSSNASADTYVGGKLGYVQLDDSCHIENSCEDDGLSGSFHLGYDFSKYFALEYGVDYLGDHKINFDQVGKNSIDGGLVALTLAPKVNLHLTETVNAFIKAGGAYMISGDERDIVPTASIGLEKKLNHNWSLRAEYQRYQDMSDTIIRDLDVNFFGLGLNYRFGEAPVPVVEAPVVEPVPARPTTRIVEHHQPAVIDKIKFGFDSDNAEVALPQTLELLNTHSNAVVEITGFADASGPEEYNQTLSERRAESVAQYLENEGIERSRMTVEGQGESSPIESNDTAEGREANRRVEVVVPTFNYTTTHTETN